MFFWKIDDNTIRCLINGQEIGNMGFDINDMVKDEHVFKEFIDKLIENSREFIEWDTGNGIQTINAKVLPADQYLLTMSATLIDDPLDKDLNHIFKMLDMLRKKGKKISTAKKVIFNSFDDMVKLANVVSGRYRLESALFKFFDMYVLVVKFDKNEEQESIESFNAMALEYGADVSDASYEEYFLSEQGKKLIGENAIEELAGYM